MLPPQTPVCPPPPPGTKRCSSGRDSMQGGLCSVVIVVVAAVVLVMMLYWKVNAWKKYRVGRRGSAPDGDADTSIRDRHILVPERHSLDCTGHVDTYIRLCRDDRHCRCRCSGDKVAPGYRSYPASWAGYARGGAELRRDSRKHCARHHKPINDAARGGE